MPSPAVRVDPDRTRPGFARSAASLRPVPSGIGRLGRAATLLLAGMCSLGLAACSGSRDRASGIFEPYKTDLPQGNYVTREMLDKVTTGMTREQVRFALGSPLLNPLFRPDRWDYVFRYQYPSGRAELRRVVIQFVDDKVAVIKADELPQRDDTSDPALPGYKPPAAAAK